jgi:ribosomal-protein-alanine N-acetyltransferase
MVHRAQSCDALELALLEELLFPENAMSARTLRGELAGGWGLVEGAPACGYVLVRDDGALVDVTRLGVHPAAQGQGIGARLLDAVLAEGRPAMLTVRKDNARALALYRRRGFAIVGSAGASWLMRRDAPPAVW